MLTENLSPRSFESIASFKTGQPLAVCDSKQWREIDNHHLRVETVFNAHLDHGVHLTPPPNKFIVGETKLAISLHDSGKGLFPKWLHEATKDPLVAARYAFVYNFHPLKTLSLLGADFVEKHRLAAELIYLHHLEYSLPPSRNLRLNGAEPPTRAFRWGLASLVVADGITSGYEIRYGREKPELQSKTIDWLESKLEKKGLAGIIDVPMATDIGYYTLSRLGF